jgi:antitoxin MazE
MVKMLSPVGNSLAVIIDKPVLDLLKIDRDTPLEISTDGTSIILTPTRRGRKDRVKAAATKMMDAHDRTFRKLAK